jgi:hypothetical protein
VETYFEKIHSSFPIINRPEFLKNLSNLLNDKAPQQILPPEQALLIYSMMALSVRFSDLSVYSSVPRLQRGSYFARQAGQIVSQLLLDSELDSPSLTFLHGCSLAAVYWLSSRPNGKAWFLVGICIRIAYSLQLNSIDEDRRAPDPYPLSPKEWTHREGLRRAWWLVVECDNFASVLQCHPFSIDRNRMHVLLPSPDQDWISGRPSTSAFLDNDVLRSWKRLKLSANRNPYAWYLLVNQLMIEGHEASLQPKLPTPHQHELQDVIQCVSMGLPQEFSLSRDKIAFEEGSVDHNNWVISLHLMLQWYRPLFVSIWHD